MTFFALWCLSHYYVCCLWRLSPYDVCRIMMFVAYWVCRIMTFVVYDVCRIMMFVTLYRLSPIMTFVAYRVCRNIKNSASEQLTFMFTKNVHSLVFELDKQILRTESIKVTSGSILKKSRSRIHIKLRGSRSDYKILLIIFRRWSSCRVAWTRIRNTTSPSPSGQHTHTLLEKDTFYLRFANSAAQDNFMPCYKFNWRKTRYMPPTWKYKDDH